VEKNKLLYATGIYSILSIEVIKLVFINIEKIIFETFNLNYLIILNIERNKPTLITFFTYIS
jgi:hypothetical protein